MSTGASTNMLGCVSTLRAAPHQASMPLNARQKHLTKRPRPRLATQSIEGNRSSCHCWIRLLARSLASRCALLPQLQLRP